jgi:hypothetical protein
MSTPDDTEPAHLDGNALGGPLAELFTTDLTAAVVTCMHCGRVAPLATYHVYADAPALVARCPGCTGVVFALRVGHARPTVRDDWRATVDDDDATRQRAVTSATGVSSWFWPTFVIELARLSVSPRAP